MEALVAGLPILVNVIDSWIFVLNDEEKYRSDEAMRRIFFNTKVMVGIMNETLQMQTRFDMFTANLTAAAPLKETVTMRNVDLDEICCKDTAIGYQQSSPKVIAHSEKFNALSDGEKIELYEVAQKTRGERLKSYKI
ncbi:hypothetical protein L6452_07391 [Arctium lappa]|uniref:Uncharacterized protein n=1 Tax=Arctium lappa TaxID=4217 RepID=A0ACB9EKQ7_ARCLA|nr:hypothetical protein L6452_07391 [Arctium lappa]